MIPFSPPDITQQEADAVAEALHSGWLTTGPRTKELEQRLAAWCGTERAVCLNSGTAALELTLRLLGIGPGDEVITTVYTYTATAAVILHVGAIPVFVDTLPGRPEMNLDQVEERITPHTKAILVVDIAGRMADYPALLRLAAAYSDVFRPTSPLQEAMDRIAIIGDGAHSFGAVQEDVPSGGGADFTCFSFHAVKNLTTGEGGAITWRTIRRMPDENIYRQLQLFSLHGQDKDALAKASGGWEYDILLPGYKCNMTDLTAAIGLVQLGRYPGLLKRRQAIYHLYNQQLEGSGITLLPLEGDTWCSSYHLALATLPVEGVEARNRVAQGLLDQGIGCNVHYKPLPLLTAYRRLGWRPEDFPHAMGYYQRELTLPLHTLLTDEQVGEVCRAVTRLVAGG